MKTTLSIGFRHPSEKIIPILPPELAFLGPTLEDYDEAYPGGPCQASRTTVPATSDLIERVIAWGRQHLDGKSIVQGATIEDFYEPSDLDGHNIVQVFTSKAVYKNCSISNYKTAYTACWTCTRCERLEWTQQDDLALTNINNRVDLQQTENYEWIVSREAYKIFAKYGVACRSLKKNKDYVQLLVNGLCPVDIHAPVIKLGPSCPVCGRPDLIGSTDVVEGGYGQPDLPEISVFHAPTLTVLTQKERTWSLAKADPEFGGFMPAEDAKSHPVGKKMVLTMPYRDTQNPKYFARTELVRDLLNEGMVGFDFRPVLEAETGT